ncbi:hypothetical protein A3L11_09130 [Thermococcus siculi]|uniref:AttH domain-containing protein n=2 Tax=Thermococcus siculi TaxID=72803 RepID=A0A2Z2MPT4_9EURY|nr:hypothetical protein A3L11_09130 [Thermococcus siculi]
MGRRYTIPYREKDHGDFDEEWPPHEGVSGWWYITGYLNDKNNPERLYSYQYTLLRARLYGITLTVLQLAFTDFQTGRHYFKQKFTLREKKVFENLPNLQFPPLAYLHKGKDGVGLRTNADEFALDLSLDYGKGAVWHGDNGVLVMGIPEDPKQRTVYYSYTNMPTGGKVTLREDGEERTLEVTGKSWLDRQWGPYSLTGPRTHWEWFSLRFFDDEEVMLFAFPQDSYYDGTYVDRDGNAHRLKDYSYTPRGVVEVNGFKFSMGWDVYLPGVKEERYHIRALMDGQMNLAYFELLAEILNPKGERVGYCFVELLPGVRNPNKRISPFNLLKRV